MGVVYRTETIIITNISTPTLPASCSLPCKTNDPPREHFHLGVVFSCVLSVFVPIYVMLTCRALEGLAVALHVLVKTIP